MQDNITHEDFGEMLKILCCRFEKNVKLWNVVNIFTPFWRFYCNFQPGASLTLASGDKIMLEPGYFYIVPDNMLFSTAAENMFDQFYIHFTMKYSRNDNKNIFKLKADEHSLKIIENFCGFPHDLENRQLIHLSALAVLSTALLKLDKQILLIPPELDPRIKKVIEKMHKHPESNFSNDFFARMTGMSRNSFLRLFETQIGEAPQTYFRRKRIEQACSLLHFSEKTIDEIAIATGFADRYHFSRVFKKLMRYSPAKFRKQLRSS